MILTRKHPASADHASKAPAPYIIEAPELVANETRHGTCGWSPERHFRESGAVPKMRLMNLTIR
jgi:hypothetical protein